MLLFGEPSGPNIVRALSNSVSQKIKQNKIKLFKLE